MRTLLLVFIHGFRGDEDTFGNFPEEKVIDIEVENGTPSPMIDPSVHVILVAHSMGGIVAADTLLSILDDKPIPAPKPETEDTGDPAYGSKDPRLNSEFGGEARLSDDDVFLFPYINGILAFDTPYLGLSPGMFANSAAGNFQAARNAYSTFTGVASAFGWGSTGSSVAQTVAKSSTGGAAAALPAAGTAASTAAKGWQWGKMAMYAGAASGIAATAAAAYVNRAEITLGFGWVTSHLEFVSVLAKISDLRQRATRASSVPGVGIANFYTELGKAATPSTAGNVVSAASGGGGRTFCSLPQAPKSTKAEVKKYGTQTEASSDAATATAESPESKDQAKMFEAGEKAGVNTVDLRGWWYPALNDSVTDEIKAHMSMFQMSTNPRYKEMLDESRRKIVEWAGSWCNANVDPNAGGQGHEASREQAQA